MFASHSSFYSLVHWLSFNYEYSPMCCVFGTFPLVYQLGLWKPQRLTCSSDSQQDVALVDCWPASTFSRALNLFLTATITEKGRSLSFCGGLEHLCLYWSGWNNAGWASSACVSQVSGPSRSTLLSLWFRVLSFSSSSHVYPLDPLVFSDDDVAAVFPEITQVMQRAGYSLSLLLLPFVSQLQPHTTRALH